MIGGREGNLRIRLYVHATHINVTVSQYGEATSQAHKASNCLERPADARERRCRISTGIQDTYNFKEPTNRSHPITQTWVNSHLNSIFTIRIRMLGGGFD